MIAQRILLACMLILLVAYGAPAARAQQPTQGVSELQFRRLTTEDGLSHKHVDAILQDRRGFLWFGTWDGLDRYDGYQFTSYRHNPNDPTSISSNVIRSLMESSDGMLWIATLDSGVSMFNPHTQRFTNYLNDQSNLELFGIAEGLNGTIWMGTRGSTLLQLDPATNSVQSYQIADREARAMISGSIWTMIVEPSGVMWMAGNLLQRFDPSSGALTLYRADGPPIQTTMQASPGVQTGLGRPGQAAPPEGGPPGGPGGPPPGQAPPPQPDPEAPEVGGMGLQSLIRGADGRFWLGGNGLYSFDPETQQLTSEPFKQRVGDIYEDSQGLLWISSNTGLHTFDPSTRTTSSHYQNSYLNPSSLSTNSLSQLYGSGEQLLWIGSPDGGVNMVNLQQQRFTVYRYDPLSDESFASGDMAAIHQDTRGNLWVGTGRVLNQLDRRTGRVTQHRYAEDGPLSQAIGRPETAGVGAILEDAQGDLWFDGIDGLYRYEPGADRFTRYRPPGLAADAAFSTWALVRDQQGMLWMGMERQGLYRFDPATKQFEQIPHIPGQFDSLPTPHGMALLVDAAGDLWIGRDNATLSRRDHRTGEMTNFPNAPAGRIHTLHQDRAGGLWVGAASGLYRFDAATQQFVRYTDTDGLPSNTIYSLQEDSQGMLWVGTARGLARFDPQSTAVRIYTAADGLPSSELNLFSSHRTADGELLFGGPEGVFSFAPEKLRDSEYQPQVLLTELLLFNEPVGVGGAESPLSAPVWETPALTFAHDQDRITFEFASLSFAAPQSNRYRYRLEGYEPDWTEVQGDRRVATYTNLPAGSFTFRVQGTNNDGLWSEHEARLALTVLPPWWETLWFRTLALLVAAAALLAIYSWRVRAIQQRNLLLEHQVAERTQELRESNVLLQQATAEAERARAAAETANQAKSIFLANMSHELRSPLNAILGFSQILARNQRLDPDTHENVGIIRRSGEHLLSLINQVLDLSKIEAQRTTLNEQDFDLHLLLSDIEDMFALRADDKQLQLLFEVNPGVPRYLRTDELKLRQVLINLLNNAIKFTAEGGVAVRVARKDLTLASDQPGANSTCRILFEVQDSGPGIAPEEMGQLFEAFAQTSAGRQAQEGTGLGLPISRKFVQLMGGDIEVSSVVGQGSVFRFEILALEVDGSAISATPIARRVIGLAPDQPAYRILIADDKDTNRRLLLKLLAPMGFELREAENGRRAVEIWEEWEPQLIWMDMRMPVLNGYEAAREIKSHTKGQATVIVALTASTLEEERATVLSAGCDEFLRKPFRDADILEMMQRFLGVQYLYEEPRAPASAQATPLSGATLATLPAEWRARFGQALNELDITQLLALLGELGPEHAATAATLTELVNSFAFERLSTLLEQAQPAEV